MNTDCQYIIFSDKAYNAIINESFKKDPLETGGILLGHILDNGIWIVMDVLPPGWNSTFQYAYFEYDEHFVNYLAQSVATEYEQELSLLGLWHRHPGSFDSFSGTDDGTNRTFAGLNSKGAISGLVNIDPKFRLTMYHVSNVLRYQKVTVEIGNDLIPEEYFKLKHFPKNGLNPDPPEKKNERTSTVKEYARDSNNYEDSLISMIMRYLDSKFLFLLIFVAGVALSLFSLYSHNELKGTDDIKTVYKVFYSNAPINAISIIDSLRNVEREKATNEFNTKFPNLKDSLDATTILLKDETSEYEKFCQNDSVTKDTTKLVENFKKYLFKGAIDKYCKEHNIKDSYLINKTTDSLIKNVYEPALVDKEIQTQTQRFIDGRMKCFLERYAHENNNLIIISAGEKVWYVIISLAICTVLSLFIALIPKKKEPIIDWLTVVSLLIISLGIICVLNYKFRLLNPLSLSYYIAVATGFIILSFIAFVAMWISNLFQIKPVNDTKYWFQKYPHLYIEEEKQIRQQFADAEKSVENGAVSFFIKTHKQNENQTEPLAFQLVYSPNYDKNKEIKVYLLNPDLDELLSNKLKNIPNIEIDSAGESYLALSKTIKKDKVNGMEVIHKLYEWVQLYATKNKRK